jgi:class 3 adenylate cyclase
MPDFAAKSLQEPDDTIRMKGVDVEVVDIGDLTVGRAIHQPGWRWSTHIQPMVGGEWCQVRHVGVVLSGRLGITLEDGTSFELEEDDVYDVPPGHDGYVIGHEPVVMIEWAGIRKFAGFMGGVHNRVLATLLVTGLVDAEAKARQMGDAAWKQLLSEYLEASRMRLDQAGGTEISTTRGGMLATFNSPLQALRSVAQIRDLARGDGITLRAGLHVGEIEMTANDVRGAAVHEAERIMESAEADEILVSETTKMLASTSGMTFEDRGRRSLPGLTGEWGLYAFTSDGV